ncbi:MAG: hypothetical protein WBD58_07995 [Geitlerinemataceae cyanobacterium]
MTSSLYTANSQSATDLRKDFSTCHCTIVSLKSVMGWGVGDLGTDVSG